MLTKVNSVAHSGLKSFKVEVEVNVASRGLPGFDIVGMPTKAVNESRERVKTALTNSKIEFPARRITVNLAPADIPKEGSYYDLPIAVGILASVEKFSIPERSLFVGELSLDGSLGHIKGSLLAALFAQTTGFTNIFVPVVSANEAAVVEELEIYGVKNIRELLKHLQGNKPLLPQKHSRSERSSHSGSEELEVEFDMAEVLGQEKAKRAAEIAAAGGHNILLMGPPGSGKTMLARAMCGILPGLNRTESLEVTKIHSVSGNIAPGGGLITTRQFRSPHHTTSSVGLIGGGSKPQPGEVSLAHYGVLFMDEFAEFPRSVMEALRQPLEDGKITISRSREKVQYPADFMLVASSNPCPCGFLNHPKKACACTPRQVAKYTKRLSGPILDRIDLHVEVMPVETKELSIKSNANKFLEPSRKIRARVEKAREIQRKRLKSAGLHSNSQMKNKHIKEFCKLAPEVETLLRSAADRYQLSARAFFRIIKVARTIADMEESSTIGKNHILEALQYRPKIYEYIN